MKLATTQGPEIMKKAVHEYFNEMTAAAQQSFEEVLDNRIPAGITVKTRVFRGHPAEEVVKAAETEGADMIVTATHGWTGWRRFVFGSVAEKIVCLSTCPVLTVPVQGD